MSRKSLHCKSLVLGYYPILPEMFWSSGFLIFRRKNRWKIIFDGSYGKLFSRSFSFYFSADFSIHSFLNNSWGNFVYKRNQGVECHGNHRTQLYQMPRNNPVNLKPLCGSCGASRDGRTDTIAYGRTLKHVKNDFFSKSKLNKCGKL